MPKGHELHEAYSEVENQMQVICVQKSGGKNKKTRDNDNMKRQNFYCRRPCQFQRISKDIQTIFR